MKTGKILLKTALVLIIALAMLIPSTFSWYDHSGEQTGNRMGYSRSDLPVSAGTVSVVTKKYRTENNKLWYDTKGNKEYDGSAITGSSSVAASNVQYYGTTFTNTGSAPAYVNLYLKDLTNSPTVKVGTLQPSLTDKNISSSVHLTYKNMIRVYFQVKTANDWSNGSATTYLVYKTKTNSTYQYKTITESIGSDYVNGSILGGEATKYVDLEDDTTEFYFATNGNNNGFNTSDCSVTQPWYRTQTITNIQAETGYYLTGVADDTTFNAQYATFNIPGGVSVKTYFNNMTINKDQHAYVTLTNGVNFTGNAAAYTLQASSAQNIISVNGNSGYVTAGSGFNNGSTATIRTTVTGSLGDTTYVDTAVSNPSTQAAPIALNVEVPGTSTNDDGETVNGTAEIVWYIDNSATGAVNVSFQSVYYTE